MDKGGRAWRGELALRCELGEVALDAAGGYRLCSLTRIEAWRGQMRVTFPDGTLSGAPKIRARQIIGELEQTARGTHGERVRYFSVNGKLNCCITVRTALI